MKSFIVLDTKKQRHVIWFLKKTPLFVTSFDLEADYGLVV